MPQKKPVNKRKTTNKRKKTNPKIKFGNKTLSYKSLIFVLVFAAIGGYFLIKSFAAPSTVLTSINLDATNSLGAAVVTETSSSNKNNTKVVQVGNYPGVTSAKATLKPQTTLDTGVYQACLFALSNTVSISGTLQITNYANAKPSTVLAQTSYTLPVSNEYKNVKCLDFTNTTASASISAIVYNKTSGGVMRIGNVNMKKIGNILPPPPSGDLPYGYGQANGPSGTWNLKFNDEFDGTTLNTANWTSGWVGGTSPVQSQELACYYPEQVRIANGILRLVAEQKNSTCSKGTNPHPYTSGAIDSHGKKSFSYGYFEAKIWLDAASDGSVANWPAWWLDGTNWPNDGEMDIMEGLSGNANATWHGPVNGGAGFSFGKGGHRTGWHTFAAEWKPGEVISYYDGVRLGSYSSSSNITSAKQFLILGMQMSPEGRYGGKIKAPTEMKVDYVRVWQR